MIFRALPGRRRGGGGLGDTFTTTSNASYGVGNLLGGKPRSAGLNIGGSTDPMLGNLYNNKCYVVSRSDPRGQMRA